MQPLNIAIDGLTLDTVVGAGPHDDPVTLLDAIVNAAVLRVAKEDEYRSVHRELSQRVAVIRDEVIREQVTPLVTDAMSAPIVKTNQWGDPTGEGTTTLRELILAQVNDFFTKLKSDSYGRTSRTAAAALVAEKVDAALKQELLAAVRAEKDKVVAAVQAKAAELIAESLRGAIPAVAV